MRTLSNAGVYTDFPIGDYMADPCPDASLSQSIVKVLLKECPLEARFKHPRFNPQIAQDDEKKFDIGNVAHHLLLKRGREIVTVDAPNWQTRLAKEERKAAIQDGKLPILLHQHERARRMAEEVRPQLSALAKRPDLQPEHKRMLENAFSQGSGEVVCTAFDGNAGDGVWLRTMIDWMESTVCCVDYKTTDMAPTDYFMQKYAGDYGFYIQAAMQERILDILFPDEAGRRQFVFVCQRTSPPYLLNVIAMKEIWMEWGRREVQRAVDIWADCLHANNWPVYATRVLQPEFPSYLENRLLEREIADAAKERRPEFNPNVLMAG